MVARQSHGGAIRLVYIRQAIDDWRAPALWRLESCDVAVERGFDVRMGRARDIPAGDSPEDASMSLDVTGFVNSRYSVSVHIGSGVELFVDADPGAREQLRELVPGRPVGREARSRPPRAPSGVGHPAPGSRRDPGMS